MLSATDNRWIQPFMRRTLLLITLVIAMPCFARSQTTTGNSQRASLAASPCIGSQLSVRRESEDAGAGQRYVSYSFKNQSPSPCTLSGFPGFALLDRAGRKIRRQSITHIPDPVTAVTLAPGGKAFFNIHYSACMTGGTPPCKSSAKVRIEAPGTNRPFVLRERAAPYQRSVELSPIRGSKLP